MLTAGALWIPDSACRFVRYLAASERYEVKASFWERVIYSYVLATAPNQSSRS